ncbi:hypothetical protein HDV05_003943 [Chytridiales sp. JEL 0842]|nr:hypothetical protein HDV05_003943 [Chytridiales sp. JEL 0842]
MTALNEPDLRSLHQPKSSTPIASSSIEAHSKDVGAFKLGDFLSSPKSVSSFDSAPLSENDITGVGVRTPTTPTTRMINPSSTSPITPKSSGHLQQRTPTTPTASPSTITNAPKLTAPTATTGQVTSKLANLSIPSHLQKKILNTRAQLSPSSAPPLSPRMISAIEKERALGAKSPVPEKDATLIECAPTTTSTSLQAITTSSTRSAAGKLIVKRTKIIVETTTEEDTDLPLLIPKILSYVRDERTLRSCLMVSKVFMHAAVGELYKHISLTGSSGPVLSKLVKLMRLSQEGRTMTDYRPVVRSLHISDLVLDEQEVTPYQSWNMARELIRRVAPTLERLILDSDDNRFKDPEYVPAGSCGLDQRVYFPRIKELTIGAGCLAFPDEFILDLMRRCPHNSLRAVRLPGCISSMGGTGYFLISERGGTALEELILTPPSSYPPPYPTINPNQHSSATSEAGSLPASRRGSNTSITSLTSFVFGSKDPAEEEVSHIEDKDPFNPQSTWEPDLFADGLQVIATACPNLKAIDISGHTIGLRAGILETLLNSCPELEEIDLPCGLTDANLYEVLMARPEQLWRLNCACSCFRTYWDPLTPKNVGSYIPCSFLTDGVVKALVDEVMPGKPGALLELPTHVMEVSSARMLPTLAVLEESVAGAKQKEDGKPFRELMLTVENSSPTQLPAPKLFIMMSATTRNTADDDLERRPLTQDVDYDNEQEVEDEEQDDGEGIWPTRGLTFVEKARLFWEENIVIKRRLPQVYGLLLSIVIVLATWFTLRAGPDLPADYHDIYDDEAPRNLPEDWTKVRLPSHVVPVTYGLDFRTDLDKLMFDGRVDVKLNLTESSRIVVFHVADLKVWDAVMVHQGKTETLVYPARNRTEVAREFVVLTFDKALKKGSWTLKVQFSGVLTESLRGYYISTYKSAIDGTEQVMASTQFQPTDARRAFPCFDEPGFKAFFQINMTVADHLHALSNMPYLSVSNLPAPQGSEPLTATKWKKYVFGDTVRMSTYLVAYAVSDFESISAFSSRGVKMSVWTQPGKTKLGEYALKVAIAVLDYYEKAFGIAYPLPKMDLLPLSGFAAGAMENFGLVTYRDTALLYDEKTSSAKNKQRVAVVIAHETAHQWFGNLVSMEWWGDLFLNEGFATFMEYKGANAAEPNWRVEDQFIFEDSLKALDSDSSLFTHPVAATVDDPAEIEEIFDDISYAKGGALLKMLESYLAAVEDKSFFMSRISAYLSKYSYSNAEALDLWNALDKPGLNVAPMMQSWTSQPGYPVLIVEDEDDGVFSVRQQRFLISNALNMTTYCDDNSITAFEPPNTKPESQFWLVPVMYTGHGRGGVKIGGLSVQVIKSKEPVILKAESASVLLLNAGRKGLYRVMYPLRVWKLLVNWVENEMVSAIDRAGLLSDAFALSWAGILQDPTVPLSLTRSLKNEKDFVVWKIALHEISQLDQALALDQNWQLFVEYQKKLIEPIAAALGWNETSKDTSKYHTRGLLRSEILSEAVALGDKETVSKALEYFYTIKNASIDAGIFDNSLGTTIFDLTKIESNLDLSPDLLNVVWDAGVIYGTEEDYEFVLKTYEKASFAVDKSRLLHALSSARRPHLIWETLNLALSNKVRRQDLTSVITNVADLYGPTHIQVWLFIKECWPEIVKLWEGRDWTQINNMLKTVVSLFTKPSMIEEAENLFVKKTGGDKWFVPPLGDRAVMKGIEIARTRVEFLDRHRNQVIGWLKAEANGEHESSN